MSKPHRPSSGRTNCASCVVATIFLIFIVIVALIVFFTVFKPQDPKLSVTSVQLPSFAMSNNTVNFTFSQLVAVRNPNKAAFSHYDSTIQLIHSGSQIGFMFIPAGKIEAGQTQYMSARFTVQSFPLSNSPVEVSSLVEPTFNGQFGGAGLPGNGNRVGPSLQIESRMEMAGRVRVLNVFSHHVEAKSGCRIQIAVSDGSVLGFRC